MSNKPTHYLNQVTGEGRSAVFTRVAGLWETQSGGLSGSIPEGITIAGRVVITVAKTADQGGQQ